MVYPVVPFAETASIGSLPAPFLSDLMHQKKKGYTPSDYLGPDSVSTIKPVFLNFLYNYFTRAYPVDKGEIYLYASLPYINSFNFRPVNEGGKTNTGFGGIALGLDYAYAKNRLISIGLTGVIDFLLPFPAVIDFFGEHESIRSGYISLVNNYKIKRYSIGYGLSYAKNTWLLKYYDRFDAPPPTREPVKKSHHAFGLVFPVYIQLGKQVHGGVVYRPTFFTPGLKNKFNYEHLISIDFMWKIRVKS